MRRSVVVTVLALSLLTPGAAVAQRPDPCASPTSPPTHCDEGHEAPSPSPSPKPTCASVFFSVDRKVITAGEVVTVTARRTTNTPEQSITATLQRVTPEPRVVVRSDSSTVTVVEWPLRLGESHRLYADSSTSTQDCFPLGAPSGFFFDVDVLPVVSIAATRTAARSYSFTGRVLPARGQFLTLYRHDQGRRVITAQTHLRPDGTYRFDRRFTGSGRFGFSVLASETSANLAGSSTVRPTAIH